MRALSGGNALVRFIKYLKNEYYLKKSVKELRRVLDTFNHATRNLGAVGEVRRNLCEDNFKSIVLCLNDLRDMNALSMLRELTEPEKLKVQRLNNTFWELLADIRRNMYL
jgi:hypothetical protein